jgi:hypothetical protein
MKTALLNIPAIFLLASLITLSSCSQKEETGTVSIDNRPDSTLVIEAGKDLVTEAFAAISNALGTAMTRGGIPNAIEYCNTVALALTDSVSKQYNVDIRRASHRPRNPRNRANELEMASIEAYLVQISEGAELSPRLTFRDTDVVFHSPLRLMTYTCLSCHGNTTDDIREEDLAIIRQFYPEDEAVNFDLDELRGIWTVTFPYTYFEETTP